MREIKFKFVFRYAEANITHITRPYTMDELVSNEQIITTEEIAEELLTCNCQPIGESLYAECNCDEFFDHFELIDRIEWSGILDNHGVEIYEGDIYKDADFSYIIDFGEYEFEGDVWFGVHSRCISDTYNHCGPLCKEDNHVIEVVGNRFQHPELLNAK